MAPGKERGKEYVQQDRPVEPLCNFPEGAQHIIATSVSGRTSFANFPASLAMLLSLVCKRLRSKNDENQRNPDHSPGLRSPKKWPTPPPWDQIVHPKYVFVTFT
eukprot:1136703-Pelagomonas_calceolata.AAC.3